MSAQEVSEFGPLAATLADALADSAHGPAYKLAASAESHCGLCQLFVREELRATGGKAVGPIALCKIPLPLPLEPAGGGAGSDGSAAPAGGAAAAAAGGAEAEAAGGAEAEAAGGSKPLPYYLYVAGELRRPVGMRMVAADGAQQRRLPLRLQPCKPAPRHIPSIALA